SIDEDCDGDIDEGLETTTFYADEDGDGFGDPTSAVESCSEPEGTVEDFSDCDDGDARAHPGAREIPWNDVDEDCDGYDIDFEECADDTVGNSLDFVTGYTYTVSDMSGDITAGIFDIGDWSITDQVLWLRNEEHSVSTTAEVDEIDVSIDVDIYMTANLYADDAITGISNCDIEVGPVPVNYSGIMEINPRAAYATSEIELDMLLLADPSSSTSFGGCDLALLDMIVGFTDLPLDFTGMVDSTVTLVAGEVGELLEDDIEIETELTCRD
ncbi:MAG: putative metal-binding motif-containing protein, partial [Myxococcota bacterium]